MVVAAGEWYSSGTFWAVAVPTAVALLIGVPTFWVTWVPRQRLFYGAPPATQLVTQSAGITDLEVRHRGRPLSRPQLLDVVLASRGRRDIPSSAFDQGRPLVFDVAAPIVEVLQVRCDPPSALTPPITHDGSTLAVGPELIGRRQITTISLLVDGTPRLSCTQPVLAQVTIAKRADLTPAGIGPSRRWPLAAVAVAVAVAGVNVVAASAVEALKVWVVLAAVLAAAAVTAVTAAAVTDWSRPRR